MSGRVLVLSPPPNANGDLHLGHVAGPFLAADVYTRYARATGRNVLFGTGVQDTSTFVLTTATKLGVPADELIARSTEDVARTLAAIGVEVDGFTGPEERFTKQVLNFMDRLHAGGRLRRKAMPFPFLPRTGEFLVDGFVRGGCPHCLAEGCAGPCEGCGHPILPGELVVPRSTQYPDDPVELRDATVYVLPVEEYRAGLL
ncbi:MAG TPA: class I tRNA ligase family protein, partial [Pseudonocardiaceae bacterium]